jgi:hypothetical protein
MTFGVGASGVRRLGDGGFYLFGGFLLFQESLGWDGFWGFFLIWVFGVFFWIFGAFFWVFGLSLWSYWFISVPPVRGGTYFSLPAAKKSRQKKAAQTANS